MANQLHDLMVALQVCKHCLRMGDYTSSAQLILQVIWALILMACNVYGQVCTCSQLEPATGKPCMAKATLGTYMHMITLKMKLDLDGLPMQLEPTGAPPPGPRTHQHHQTTSPKKATNKVWAPPHLCNLLAPAQTFGATCTGPTSSPPMTQSNSFNPKGVVRYSLNSSLKSHCNQAKGTPHTQLYTQLVSGSCR